jgi:hypothetical protein
MITTTAGTGQENLPDFSLFRGVSDAFLITTLLVYMLQIATNSFIFIISSYYD